MSAEHYSRPVIPPYTLDSARNQINNQANQLRNTQNALDQANQQRYQDNQRFAQDLNRRDQAHQQSVNRMQSDMRASEQRHNQVIRQQSEEFTARVYQERVRSQQALLEEKSQRIQQVQQQKRELENRMDKAVGEERKQRQQQVQRLESTISQLETDLSNDIRNVESTLNHKINLQDQRLNQRIDQTRFELKQSILQEKNERVRAMQVQKRELEDRMDNLVEEERHERQRQIKHLANQMQEMEQELRQDIARVEKEFNQKINTERKERRQEISNLKDWTARNLEHQRQEYLHIAEVQQQQLNDLRQDVSRIFAQQNFNRQTAEAFINDLEIQIAYIQEHLPHQRFTPGKLDALRAKVNNAKNTLQNMEQAAFANAQQAYYDMVDLRNEILLKEQEYNMWYSTALEAARSLFETIRANRKLSLEDNAGTVEADYWTNSEFSKLEKEVETLKNRLENEKDKLSLEDVKQILSQLERLSERQEILVKEALERVISSEYRAMMGDMVVEALEKEGFAVTHSGYEMQDQRKVYLVRMENVAGTEIVAVIAPDDQTNANILSINTRDKNGRVFSQEVLEERNNRINEILREEGLQIEKSTCKKEHIDEFYDVENILKQGGKGIPQRVLEKARMLNSQTRK